MLETLVRLQVGSYEGDFVVITENLVGRDNQQERLAYGENPHTLYAELYNCVLEKI